MTPRDPIVSRQVPGSVRSPWSVRIRMRMLLWEVVWNTCCRWTPKPANRWRLFVLRCFGATVLGQPFVHQRARIAMPWNIELHDGACVGDAANLYSLARITLHSGALVAQEAYLCCGSHELHDPTWPLVTAPIEIGERAFIGARAFLLPGVRVGRNAIVGAMAAVTRNVPDGARIAGNPARPIGPNSRSPSVG